MTDLGREEGLGGFGQVKSKNYILFLRQTLQKRRQMTCDRELIKMASGTEQPVAVCFKVEQTYRALAVKLSSASTGRYDIT